MDREKWFLYMRTFFFVFFFLSFFSKRWHDEVETMWWNLKLVGACDDPRIKINVWSGLLLVHVFPIYWSVASHRGNPSDDPRIKKRPLCASQPFFWWFKALLKWSVCVWCWFAFPFCWIFLLRKVLYLPYFTCVVSLRTVVSTLF
jgi:hypothetical protein